MLTVNQDQTAKDDTILNAHRQLKDENKYKDKNKTDTSKSDYSRQTRIRPEYCIVQYTNWKYDPLIVHYSAPEPYCDTYQYYDHYNFHNMLPTHQGWIYIMTDIQIQTKIILSKVVKLVDQLFFISHLSNHPNVHPNSDH